MISRSTMSKQLTGNRMYDSKKKPSGKDSQCGLISTGSDARDLEAIRSRNKGMGGNQDQVVTMKSGGKTKSKVNEAGNYTKPSMRKRLFNKIKAGGKGGKPGQWSARKAQMLASQYKKAGGGYRD